MPGERKTFRDNRAVRYQNGDTNRVPVLVTSGSPCRSVVTLGSAKETTTTKVKLLQDTLSRAVE